LQCLRQVFCYLSGDGPSRGGSERGSLFLAWWYQFFCYLSGDGLSRDSSEISSLAVPVVALLLFVGWWAVLWMRQFRKVDESALFLARRTSCCTYRLPVIVLLHSAHQLSHLQTFTIMESKRIKLASFFLSAVYCIIIIMASICHHADLGLGGYANWWVP